MVYVFPLEIKDVGQIFIIKQIELLMNSLNLIKVSTGRVSSFQGDECNKNTLEDVFSSFETMKWFQPPSPQRNY